jgi:L-cysteine:1D-myo-inositol 2-amino-2-deoxy-alpha-D-glucopyranoside ligase
MAIRFALMSQHYRLDRMWTDELLESATQRIAKIREAIASPDVASTKPVIEKMILALSNDLDTPTALAHLDKWALDSTSGASGGDAKELATALDALLGLAL